MREYKPVLTAEINAKGVCDVDTVKGCRLGMAQNPKGCYGACYAYRIAKMRGFDFTKSVSRLPVDRPSVKRVVRKSPWYRIGTFGDPCHDWDLTADVIEWLSLYTGKIAVVITKHWIPMSKDHMEVLKNYRSVVNTSVSALDDSEVLSYRLKQHEIMTDAGVKSILRVITCDFKDLTLDDIQRELLSYKPIIDNPLRVPLNHPLLKDNKITVTKCPESVGGGSKWVSLHSKCTYHGSPPYLGNCSNCLDQCGVNLV